MKVWSSVLVIVFVASCLAVLGMLAWQNNSEHYITTISMLSAILALASIPIQINKQNWKLLQSIRILAGRSDRKIKIEELPSIVEGTIRKFKLISEHIRQLGNIKEIPPIHDSLMEEEVGQALVAVQAQMKTLKEEEDAKHWIAEGLAKFAHVLRNKTSLHEYSASIIGTLVKWVGANQGGLFLQFENEREGQYLELTGSYAYEKKRYVNMKVQPGEGLLGQCMYERDTIFITDIPKDYVRITSGLGLATPSNIVVVPLLLNEVFYGAFELASFEILKPYQVEFLKKVAVMIAAEIGSIKTLEHTKALLNESDDLSKKLQAQEEEMRMNLEELTAAQEEMSRHQIELEKKQAELNSYLSAIDNTIASAEFSLEGKLTTANNLFLTITGYSSYNVKGKTYAELFNNDQTLHMMWENIQLGKFFSGEFRMHDQNGKELWMNGTLNPIFDSNGKPEKVMLFAQFTTQEKEKLNELGGMVQAIKQTLPVIECTADFQCKNANDKFMKMFGVSRMQLKDKTLDDFMPGQMRCAADSNWKDELLKGNTIQCMLEFNVSGQSQKWEVSASTIRDLSGNISRVVVMLLHEAETRVIRLAI
jgi:PAS domain S-box-containing protein